MCRDSYLNSKIFHFICSPSWASQHITEILKLRDKQLPPPIFVWEPVPNSTIKENLQSCVEAMKMVNVLSPNHEEAAALLGLISGEDEEVDRFLSEDMLMYMADKFLSYQIGPQGNGCVIIRASYKGCLVATKEKKEIIPAYWTLSRDGIKNPHVIDVTGAGNAFCGGFMAGLLRSNNDVFEAALYGSVSASFTVEQHGAQKLELEQNGNEWAFHGIDNVIGYRLTGASGLVRAQLLGDIYSTTCKMQVIEEIQCTIGPDFYDDCNV